MLERVGGALDVEMQAEHNHIVTRVEVHSLSLFWSSGGASVMLVVMKAEEAAPQAQNGSFHQEMNSAQLIAPLSEAASNSQHHGHEHKRTAAVSGPY